MDYCTLDDVSPLNSIIGQLSDDTQLTEAGAGTLITQVSAELDGHLRAKGYAIPIIDPEALATLRAYCMSGSAARILRSIFPVATGVSGDGGAAAAHEKVYADGLALIDKGGLAADMVLSGGCNVADGFPHRHHYSHRHDGYGRRFYAGYPDPY